MSLVLRIAGFLVLLALVARLATVRHNARHLAGLGDHRPAFDSLVDAIEERSGCWVWITSGARSAEEQGRLARRDPRNAKPGTSRHESARAIDLNLMCPMAGMVRKASPLDVWHATGAPAIARERGFAWGGDIRGYYDPVHFQL